MMIPTDNAGFPLLSPVDSLKLGLMQRLSMVPPRKVRTPLTKRRDKLAKLSRKRNRKVN